MQFYLSDDITLNSSDALLATVAVPAKLLKPKQTVLVTSQIALPAGTTTGINFIFAVLTPGGSADDTVAANDVAASHNPLEVLKHALPV